jgi:hypothetical protein
MLSFARSVYAASDSCCVGMYAAAPTVGSAQRDCPSLYTPQSSSSAASSLSQINAATSQYITSCSAAQSGTACLSMQCTTSSGSVSISYFVGTCYSSVSAYQEYLRAVYPTGISVSCTQISTSAPVAVSTGNQPTTSSDSCCLGMFSNAPKAGSAQSACPSAYTMPSSLGGASSSSVQYSSSCASGQSGTTCLSMRCTVTVGSTTINPFVGVCYSSASAYQDYMSSVYSNLASQGMALSVSCTPVSVSGTAAATRRPGGLHAAILACIVPLVCLYPALSVWSSQP